jgi:chaperonin GroES
MEKKIIPLPGYVLIEPIEDETKTPGGFYVPETEKDKPSKGKVLAVGNFVKTDTIKLPVWDQVSKSKVVVYKKWVNQEVDHKGKKLLLVNLNDLLAVIE